jgi:hypothetical protein
MADERDRLMKLIRLLSSDKDGEALAAVRAIEKTLKASGKSFHDLADTLAGKFVEVIRVVEKVVVKERRVEVVVDHSCESWIKATDKLLESGKLVAREIEFVRDMQMRFRFTPNYEASPKQSAWLAAIYKRVFPDWKTEKVA